MGSGYGNPVDQSQCVMRVLLIVASLRPETGGPARSVPGLANALADRGVEVHVWSPDVPEILPGPVRFICHRGKLEEILDQIKELDLIHDNGLWLPMNHWVARESKRRGIPRIVSPRGMLEPWALNQKKWKKRSAWWIYQRRDLHSAAMLHATAESEFRQFKRLGLPCAVATIPNGVEMPEHRGRLSVVDCRHGEQRTALFLSRIHSKKGLPLLVDAWARVKPAGWRMVVAGPDENYHRTEVEALVKSAGLSGEWDFCGALEGEEKRGMYEKADLFILPTYSENFGIAVAEAMAHGLPVITTHGAPWKLLEEEQCGWWVSVSVDGIAAALDDATHRRPEELTAMGARGQVVVAERFSWDRIAGEFVECYRWILGERKRPACVQA
jgi:glycosyltransferase involved in cell wall biosynthesis